MEAVCTFPQGGESRGCVRCEQPTVRTPSGPGWVVLSRADEDPALEGFLPGVRLPSRRQRRRVRALEADVGCCEWPTRDCNTHGGIRAVGGTTLKLSGSLGL